MCAHSRPKNWAHSSGGRRRQKTEDILVLMWTLHTLVNLLRPHNGLSCAPFKKEHRRVNHGEDIHIHQGAWRELFWHRNIMVLCITLLAKKISWLKHSLFTIVLNSYVQNNISTSKTPLQTIVYWQWPCQCQTTFIWITNQKPVRAISHISVV